MKTKNTNRPDPSNRSKRPRRSSVSAIGGGILQVSGNVDKTKYNYRTINDVGSRIAEMESYGYDIVQDKDVAYNSGNEIQTGSSHSVVVDKRTGQKGVLMRQPIEYHEEDKQLKAEAIAKTEESMFRKLKTEDGRYGDVENTNSLAKAVED